MKEKNMKKRNEKLWFRAKYYGWGWYPSSLEGWLSLFLYMLIFVLILSRIDESMSDSYAIYTVIIPEMVLTVILIVVCYLKGEKPKWRWGIPTV